jgi:phosphodiesterase/alkaline phosphatase D-like protein
VTLPDGRVYRKVSHGPLLDVFVVDMRSYRDPNSTGTTPERILGARQARWLVESLDRSRATWKVIASDMPRGPGSNGGELVHSTTWILAFDASCCQCRRLAEQVERDPGRRFSP